MHKARSCLCGSRLRISLGFRYCTTRWAKHKITYYTLTFVYWSLSGLVGIPRHVYLLHIHTNTSISKIQKFHYLRVSIKDSAALIIQSLDFSSENYKVAWDLLCSRYSNSRLLINNHVQALFKIVTKESARALRNVIYVVNKNLRSLKTLKLHTGHWDGCS